MTTTPRYVEEYAPAQHYSTCVALYVFSMSIGALISYFSALELPPDSDKQALIESDVWKYIFAFPIVLYLIMIALLLTVVQHESPKFYIINNEREKAIEVIH